MPFQVTCSLGKAWFKGLISDSGFSVTGGLSCLCYLLLLLCLFFNLKKMCWPRFGAPARVCSVLCIKHQINSTLQLLPSPQLWSLTPESSTSKGWVIPKLWSLASFREPRKSFPWGACACCCPEYKPWDPCLAALGSQSSIVFSNLLTLDTVFSVCCITPSKNQNILPTYSESLCPSVWRECKPNACLSQETPVGKSVLCTELGMVQPDYVESSGNVIEDGFMFHGWEFLGGVWSKVPQPISPVPWVDKGS